MAECCVCVVYIMYVCVMCVSMIDGMLPFPTTPTPLMSGRVPARLQYMELTEGCIIQVLITSVRSPSEFCAQPYCPLLIELKDQIS